MQMSLLGLRNYLMNFSLILFGSGLVRKHMYIIMAYTIVAERDQHHVNF